MWLFCKQGYFSAVAHNAKPDTILLRARFQGDLERLLRDYAHLLPADFNGTPTHTPEADYAYRLELPKQAFAAIAGAIADDIDYGNFKNRVHEGHGSPRDAAYMGCWWELRKAQDSQQ